MNVTAVVCTHNRYDTTLALCLQAIAMQTYPVKALWIYDDSDKKIDLREKEPYKQLFILLQQKGIAWEVVYGNGQGQVRGHKLSLKECKTDIIWRLDDDTLPEPGCLESLMEVMDEDVGAAGGLVLDVAHQSPSKMASSRIDDIYLGLNQQWFRHSGEPYEVDHLYSTFVYKRGEDYYPSNLSRVGHREETIFTYRIKKSGKRVLVVPKAITWHLKANSGGIRDGQQAMWQQDEAVFSELMKDWGVTPREHKVITLDNGLGDHYAFKTILPRLIDKFADNLTLACCYPDVFRDFDINIISIGEAYGGGHRDGVYKWMVENNHKGNLVEAYEKIYC